MSKKSHTALVIGNWKMNPATLTQAQKLLSDLTQEIGRKKIRTQVVISPPFPFLHDLYTQVASMPIVVYAQDVFPEKVGAHTSQVSLPMLQSVGVSGVIVGHSERRASGETDEDIQKKIQAISKTKCNTVLCVGERVRDTHGEYFTVVEKQLHCALQALPKSKLARVVIAYEPVWAIGSGKTATAEDVHEMKLFIQKVIADMYDRSTMQKVKILYGGSVKKSNAQELLEQGSVDGFLIGGASLRAKEFAKIIDITEAYAKGSV